MMPSRGMGAVNPRKMPTAKRKARRDNTDFDEYKSGGKVADKWIQKAINPAHKGYCTPMTKPTCTPKRKALAITLKKMAKKK